MRFWTSDLHLGHTNIIEFSGRPFSDTDHMNSEFVRRWNTVVGPDDEVWIVGDFAMGRIDDTLAIANRLLGYKVLIPGNHDRCWMGAHGNAEKRREWERRYREVFDEIRHESPVETVLLDGTSVRVCHFPYVGDSTHEDRFSPWRLAFDGESWLIHGHTHSRDRVQPEWRQLHVGVDAWDYTPVPEDQLVSLVIKGT